MIQFKKKSHCCGCSACASICPRQCIQMMADEEGFLYPVVNVNQCIDCGLCEQVCPLQKQVKNRDSSLMEYIHHEKEGRVPKTYAMINEDEDIRKESSSGGIFTLIAEEILAKDGVVFGAAMTEDCRSVQHILVKNETELHKLRGSKYVQSTIGECYKRAKDYLENGRFVLFTGTPCQVEGLKGYLGRKYENLICMDLICHGVPSPQVWEKYVDYREALAGGKTIRTSFRHKNHSWKNYRVFFEFSNHTAYSELASKDLFITAFLQDLCLRPSCYECHFKKINRVSDITVADFWGIGKVMPEIDDDKGTSLVMVHSEKGANILEVILDKVYVKEVDFAVVPKYNPSMVRSVAVPKNREKFWEELDHMSFDKLVKKYASPKVSLKGLVVKVLKKLRLKES